MIVMLSVVQFVYVMFEDEVMIKIIVESVGLFVDWYEFDVFEKFYVDEFMLDYFFLFGVLVEMKSLMVLMSEWVGVLFGFDCMWYVLFDVMVMIDGDKVIVIVYVEVGYWIDSVYW